MASIFSQDNPFNDFMSTVGDMAMLIIAISPQGLMKSLHGLS